MQKSEAKSISQSEREEEFAVSGDEGQRECENVQEIQGEEYESEHPGELMEIPKELKVIGKLGDYLKKISNQTGAKSEQEEEFEVSGGEEQREYEKVQEIQGEKYESEPPGELMKIPKELKDILIEGDNLKEISNQTGAKLISKGGDVYISGTDEQKKKAKMYLNLQGFQERLWGKRELKICRFIDGCNLPKDCVLKLQRVVQGSCAQYRLKSAENYEPQETRSAIDEPTYLLNLKKNVLESLNKIQEEMKTKDYLKADMWCHFGTANISRVNEVEANERKWTIDEATETLRFESPNLEGKKWDIAFKEGVNLDEKILEETPKEYKDYTARYDLTFVTPSSYQMRAKVWVTKTNIGKKLEDIPVPLGDVKNILDEIHFEDEVTRSRCRGWLVLPARRNLQADILFPGCEFDCRLTIRGQSDCGLHTDYVPDEETRQTLSRYLSSSLKLSLRDEDDIGICLPENTPEGFHLIYKRCSKRSLYKISQGFTLVRSKESSWRNDHIEKGSRETTDFHLRCREWDELLNSGDWKPEQIAEKLPEFLQKVKKVQFLFLTKTVPPEILARGPSAMKAYNTALSDGKTVVKRIPLMLIGQDRSGKTSLKKSLKGTCYDPEEDSTVGIDVDPSHFEVSTEMWKTGEIDQNQDSDTAVTFDNQTARYMVSRLRTERESTKVNTRTEESPSNFDSETRKMEGEPTRSDPSMRAENVQTTKYSPTTSKRQIPHVSSDPTEQSQEDVSYSYPDVPDEVASKAETLLQGDLEVNEEEIYSTLWDFAGQSVYYVTHPLFLTTKGIYCLVYDLSLNPQDEAKPIVKQGVYEESQESFNLKTNMDYLEFWMKSVASLASSQEEGLSPEERKPKMSKKLPPVLLVCTHADTPYDGRDPKDLARKIFGSLKRKPYGVHLSGVFFVDNTSLSIKKSECPEVQRLRKEVLAVAKALPRTNEVVPIKWLKFEKELQAEKETGKKYISLEAAKDIAARVCNIVEDEEFETLMNYLHDLRSLIHFDDTSMLNKLVVLNPQWLVDVFKKVITVKPFDCKDTEFLELWCKLEEEGVLDEELLAHVWGPLLNTKETSESLIGIMEKFSLLCPWSSVSSSNKSYLVPSMLKSYPPEEVLELVKSAKIPSLFVKFANGQVPPGLFPRLVLQFLQWGKERFWISENPQLFHDFARFFTSQDGYSVILVCHSYSVEVVVHDGNFSDDFADDLASNIHLSDGFQLDTAAVTCARAVRRQLGLMLECMRNEFFWLRNMTYEMSVICPVCCKGKAVYFCQNHHVKGCRQEQCLHFWTVTELCSEKKKITCQKSAFVKNTKVEIMQFSLWFPSPKQQLEIGEHDGDSFHSDEGNHKKALTVRNRVFDSLSSKSCDSKEVVCRLKESLQLDQTSLEQPDPETKKWIRYLAREAKCSNRLDVVEHLREITPAGTTGPLLSESLDVRGIPFSQARQLTIALTVAGGDKWKLVAEKLDLNSEEIRFLDERNRNPVEALIGFVANQRCLTVGELYNVLCDCGIPLIADKL